MYLDDLRTSQERDRPAVPRSTWLTVALALMLILGGVIWALLEQFMAVAADDSAAPGVEGGFGSLGHLAAAVPALTGGFLTVLIVGGAIVVRSIIRRGR